MATVPVVNFTGDDAEKRGDTLDYDFTFAGVNVQTPGTLIWFTGKKSKTDPDNQAIWQKTIANGGVIVTGPTTATATLQPSDSAGIAIPGNADSVTVAYDCQVKTPAGRVQTVVEGQITFTIDITLGTT